MFRKAFCNLVLAGQKALQLALAILDGFKAGILSNVNHLVFDGDEASNLRDCVNRYNSDHPLDPPHNLDLGDWDLDSPHELKLDLVDWVYVIAQVEALGWQRLDLRRVSVLTNCLDISKC